MTSKAKNQAKPANLCHAATALAAVLFTVPAAACVEKLTDPATKVLRCHWQVPVEANAKTEVSSATGGLISDFECAIDLDVSLDALDAARQSSTMALMNPQPFQCRVTTAGGVITGSAEVGASIASHNNHVDDVEFRIENIRGIPGIVTRPMLRYASTASVRKRAAEWLEQQLSARASKP